MKDTLKNVSLKNWCTHDGNPTLEQINAGSLQRIADATELMAKRHTDLISERDWLSGAYRRASDRADHADRRIASLKGQITKLRKKLAQLAAAHSQGEGGE